MSKFLPICQNAAHIQLFVCNTLGLHVGNVESIFLCRYMECQCGTVTIDQTLTHNNSYSYLHVFENINYKRNLRSSLYQTIVKAAVPIIPLSSLD